MSKDKGSGFFNKKYFPSGKLHNWVTNSHYFKITNRSKSGEYLKYLEVLFVGRDIVNG